MAVDHFLGLAEQRKEDSQPVVSIVETGSTKDTFVANLECFGLREWVDVRVGSSVEVGAAWQGPIRLLFIGGDHLSAATRQDITTWSKHVVTGGVMAFHDVDAWPGVTQVYHELLATDANWKEIYKVRSLRMLRRCNSQRNGNA